MSETSKNYLELELICITASRIKKMVDYNGGALSEEEYIFQSRGMIIKLNALSGRYWPSGQNGRILAKIFTDKTKLRSLKRTRPIFGHLHGITWSIKDLLDGQNGGFFSWGTNAGNPERHLSCSGSQSESRIRFIFPAHGFYHTLKKGTAFAKYNLPMCMTPRQFANNWPL